MSEDRLITVAIYTYEKAQIIKGILENEGIPVAIQNVNLIQPVVSSGVRIRIRENDLPLALKILENSPVFEDLLQNKTSENRESDIGSCRFLRLFYKGLPHGVYGGWFA